MKVLGTSFSPWSGCCFSAKHATLRRKGTHWLARNQNNVSEWGDMSFRRLAVSQNYKTQTKHVGLVQIGPYHNFIEN